MKKLIIGIITLTAINTSLLIPQPSQTQAPAITPSPAPTKTTTADTTTVTPESTTITTETEINSTKTVTMTQNDLSVITGNVQRPNGAIWFENKLYIVCSGDWTIYAMDDKTGETQTYIYGVRNSHSLYAEKDDKDELTLWVPDISTGQLLQVNPARAPQPVAKNLDSPWGIAYLNETSFLITSQNGNNINIVSRDGTVTQIIEGLRSPTGITIDQANKIGYVANSGSARRAIEWFDLSTLKTAEEGTPVTSETGNSIITAPLISGLQNTTGVTLGSDDLLYFTYALGTRGVVGKIDPKKCRDQGGCTNDEVEIVIYTELPAPLAGLTLSPEMALFIHTMFRPEIYRAELQ